MKITKKMKRDWLKWLEAYGSELFLEHFLRNVEGAESVCVNCGCRIYVDIMIGMGVADWSTKDGDFGCGNSPDTNKEGTGGHVPVRRK